jgi:hypothetical protein
MLRVRTDNGQRNLILKMNINDTIGQVYEYVEDFKDDDHENIQIRSNFPRQVLEKNDPRSLKDLGFFPTGVLVMVKA